MRARFFFQNDLSIQKKYQKTFYQILTFFQVASLATDTSQAPAQEKNHRNSTTKHRSLPDILTMYLSNLLIPISLNSKKCFATKKYKY